MSVADDGLTESPGGMLEAWTVMSPALHPSVAIDALMDCGAPPGVRLIVAGATLALKSGAFTLIVS